MIHNQIGEYIIHETLYWNTIQEVYSNRQCKLCGSWTISVLGYNKELN